MHASNARATSISLPDDSLLFIGTATVLIRCAGLTILTDPNFIHRGEQAALGYGLRSTRRTDPAVEIDALPPIDAIVLSHLHGDHFDQVAEARLPRDVPILTTPSAATALDRKGFRAADGVATWETRRVPGATGELRVTALPGKHGPGPLAALLPQVMGSLLEFTPSDGTGTAPLRIYITGDTLVHDALREIPRRVGPIDLAILHLGGTRILGIKLTMDGRDGVEVMRIVQPRSAVPVHYDDYPVFRSPLSDFQAEVRAAGMESLARTVARGETIALR